MRQDLIHKKVNYFADCPDGAALSVYLVEEQKLVLVFCSNTAAAVYLKNNKKFGISTYCKTKSKLLKNHFNKPLAIRYASKEHRELLGKKEFICLDERFLRPELKGTLYSKFNK